MDSAYRVRKRGAHTDPSPNIKRTKRCASPGIASPCVTSRAQGTPATGGRGLGLSADTLTPSKPPLSRNGLQTEGCKHPPKEVLGSRKSVRRNKLPLPVKFDALLQLFGALQLVCRVNKMRGHLCVFQAAKLSVEQQCGRRFLVSHLAQMKFVYPEVISLRYANIAKTTIEGQCSGIQLIIDMSLSDSTAEPIQSAGKAAADSPSNSGSDPPKVAPSSTRAAFKAGSTATAGTRSSDPSVCKASRSNSAQVDSEEGQLGQSPSEPLRMMAVKVEFERRLEKQVMEHYKEFVETHEQGDLAAVATASEQWAADFDLEAVPDIPQADLPPQLPKAAFGASTPGSIGPAPVTGGKPPTAPRASAPGARRLSFDHMAGGQAKLDPVRESHPQQLTDEQVVQKLPEELRRQSLSGSLPVSLQALRAVTEQQAQREAMFSVDAKAARRKSAANAMLPRVFDTLRAVFGAAGPAVRLYDEVVQQLTHSNKACKTAVCCQVAFKVIV
ncbi:hypothetical protein WJX79_003012 [Trebouxia sp. C0005]